MLWLKQRQLSSKDPAVRRKAMQEFCDAPDSRTLNILRTALGDDDAEVRRLAVTALARLDDEARLEPLLGALRDRDPEVQKVAIGGLKRFNTEDRVIAALVPLIRHGDVGVRGRAAQVLELLGWRAANRDDEIWFWVCKNQFQRAASYGVAALPALECVLNSSPYNLRVGAVEAIGSIDDQRAMRPLLSALRARDPAVCVAAVEVVSRLGGPQVIEGMIGLLLHNEPAVRIAATEALGRMGAVAGVEPLRPLLRDAAWDVRRAATEALGRLKDTKSVEAMTHNLSDKDTDVREATAIALGSLRDRRAIGPLVRALKDSTSGVRRIAAAALSQIDEAWSSSAETAEAVVELKSGLQDKDPDVRYLISRLLASLGQGSVGAPGLPTMPTDDKLSVSSPEKRRKLTISLFISALGDPDRDLRHAAAEALGRLGDVRAQSALARIMADSDTGVRLAAEAALKSLSPARATA